MGDGTGPLSGPAGPAGTIATAQAGDAWQVLDVVRLVRALERERLAARLHDGPIQDLAVTMLELSSARRVAGGPDGGSPAALERHVDSAARSLRQLMDDLGPTAEAGSGLVTTLQRRTAWLLADPLAVDAGEGTDTLSPAEIRLIVELAELLLASVASAEAPVRALVAIRADSGQVSIDLNARATSARYPDQVLAWLETVAAMMRADADIDLSGSRVRARLSISRRRPA